jgi:drug/metabolite transporter (DMT)-like permease
MRQIVRGVGVLLVLPTLPTGAKHMTMTQPPETDPGKASTGPSKLPFRLSIGLLVAIILDTAVQTLWKRAATELPADAVTNLAHAAQTLMHKPLFLVVGALIAAQMFNWLKVLDDADVSFALPITALSYISVAAVSAVWLGEQLTLGRIIGMGLILAGVFLVSRTEHNTLGPA